MHWWVFFVNKNFATNTFCGCHIINLVDTKLFWLRIDIHFTCHVFNILSIHKNRLWVSFCLYSILTSAKYLKKLYILHKKLQVFFLVCILYLGGYDDLPSTAYRLPLMQGLVLGIVGKDVLFSVYYTNNLSKCLLSFLMFILIAYLSTMLRVGD